MTLFRRAGAECVARFTAQETQVLRQCVAELATLLSTDADPDDPAVERLFPDVYPEDPQAQAEFRRFTEDDLRSAKREQARTVLADLMAAHGAAGLAEAGLTKPRWDEVAPLDDDGDEADLFDSVYEVRLSEDKADVWLRALTDIRLTLGTRLGVEDDTDVRAELDAAVGRDPASPRVGQLTVYLYLTYLQESLVDALTRPSSDLEGGARV